MKDWSAASVFCTGREVTSPCDTPQKGSGPLSAECIVHLWNNQSSKKTWQGRDDPIGPTYYSSSATSLFKEGKVERSCQATGTLSPVDPNGNKKRDIIRYWQRQGGVDKVKRVMADLHRAANAQVVADDQLSPYFKQCYGNIPFAPRPPAIFTCNNSTGLPQSFTPTSNNILVDNLMMTEDYKLSMDITPRGTVGNWGSIIHFTTGGDCCAPSQRTPGIWFAPNTIDTFALHVGFANDGGWAARPSGMPFAIGKKSHFELECKGNQVKVTVDGKVYNYTHDSYRFSGPVRVYGGDPWYPPANCFVQNLCLQLSKSWTVNIGNSNTNEKIVPLPADLPSSARNIKHVPQGYSDDYVYRFEGNNLIVRRVDHFGGWGAQTKAVISEGVMPHIPNVAFVRIEGGTRVLNLSQLVVLDEYGNNISRGRPQQVNSETYGDANKTKANDGGEAPRGHPNEYHGHNNETGQDLWQVQLDGPRNVASVIVYNRSDCCADRMASGYVIKLYSPNPGGGYRQVFVSSRLNANPVQVVRTR